MFPKYLNLLNLGKNRWDLNLQGKKYLDHTIYMVQFAAEKGGRKINKEET
jgi:hypothetical protein